jgi:DNA-binding NarL/FixJ family response regulator
MVSNLTDGSTARRGASTTTLVPGPAAGLCPDSSGTALLQPRRRVLVADAAPLVRAGIRYCLREAADLEIVGEAADGPTAVQLGLELGPDIVILDLALPATNGLEVMRALGARVAGVRMLVLSQWRLEDDVRAAFAAGAAGYMLKDDDASDLAGILRGLHAGRTHVSAQVSALVVRECITGHRHGAQMGSLTRRQTEILSLIARGRTSREVGAQLGITLRTVQTHRAHIMHRLQVHTEAGLVHAALQMGLLERG